MRHLPLLASSEEYNLSGSDDIQLVHTRVGCRGRDEVGGGSFGPIPPLEA